MRHQIFLIALIAITFFLNGGQTTLAQSDVKVYKLENGLTVILNPDHNTPQVFGAVVVRAGGKDDPKGATGMAHYQEHMLFKGTEQLGTTDWEAEKIHINNIFELYDELGETSEPEERAKIQQRINDESLKANEYAIPNEMDKIIKSMGGTDMNAGTGPDITVFYNAFPPNQIEKWIDLYSHRFENPVFRSFQAELEVVYEEKNMYSDMFIFPLLEKFNEHFFKNHPYGQQTLIGTIDDLKNPSLTKMYKFFKTWYVPNNMALIIVGDFDIETIKPMIEEKFGKWESKKLPERPVYNETPFNGREFTEVKMSPIKLGMLGFRTPPAGHPDEITIEVCNAILTNENQTGLFDQLILDNKLMAAQPIYMPYNEYGACIFLIVPKIVGQKLEEAEDLVMNELLRLKNGEFDENMVESIKLELYRDYQTSMESNDYKMYMYADAFGRNQTIEDLLSYPNRLMNITKEDIMAVANKYYGENYLALYSKMGFPKKEKIEKPEYKPITKNTDLESEYAQKIAKIPEVKTEPTYIDFNTDVNQIDINKGTELFYVKNPANDIFTLKIKFKVGSEAIKELKYAADMMNYASPAGTDFTEFKKKMASLGCTYYVSGDESYTVIELTGIEKNFEDALNLTVDFIKNPNLEQSKIDILYEGEKTNRKMERSEPDNVADALFNFVCFGDKSDYIDRLSLKAIKALNADSLCNSFNQITEYPAELHYTGQISAKKIAKICDKYFTFTSKKSTETPVVRDINKYEENTIYFVHKKKATQSKVFYLVNGFNYSPEFQADMDAFNLYFGGDFSGLVLQEIREYRSMAYSAGARFTSPAVNGKEAFFVGYVGTQADKTIDAMQIFDSLMHQMPLKRERVTMIQPYLLQSSISERPHFRNMSEKIVHWQNQGFTSDPAEFKRRAYSTLEFDNIFEFYENNLAQKPTVICIVGNKKQIDIKALNKYGKVVFIKEKNLFSK